MPDQTLKQPQAPPAEEAPAREAGIISMPEAVIVLMVSGGADIADVFLTGWGEFIKWFYGIPLWLFIQIWLKMRNVKGVYVAAGGVAELIPFMNDLPMRTPLLAYTIYTNWKREEA